MQNLYAEFNALIQKRGAVLLLFFVLAALFLSTFRDYSVTIDEDLHKAMGQRALLWYATGFHYPQAASPLLEAQTDVYYPALYYTVCQVFVNASNLLGGPFDFDILHFFNMCMGFLGIVYAYKLGQYLYNRKAGCLFALVLTLTPRFYGSLFNNPKDIPFAVFYLIASYYLIKSYRLLPKLPVKHLLKLSVSIGCALGARVAGYILYPLVGFVAVLWWFMQGRQSVQPSALLKRWGVYACVLFGISWSVMLSFWPWAQLSPILNPLKAILIFAKMQYSVMYTYFEGALVASIHTPRSYLPQWLALTLPDFYWVILIFGLVFLGLSHRKLLRLTPEVWILFSLFVVPFSMIILLKSNMFAGIRHTLFLIPPLACLVGVAAYTLISTIHRAFYKFLVVAVLGLAMGVTALDMVQLHPYQAIYFNRLIAGGLSKANTLYELDSDRRSLKETSDWLLSQTQSDQKPVFLMCTTPTSYLFDYYLNQSWYITKERLRMQVLLKTKHAARFEELKPYLPERHYVMYDFLHKTRVLNQDQIKQTNYIVLTEMFIKGEPEKAALLDKVFLHKKLVHTIERQGVPLVYIYQVMQEN